MDATVPKRHSLPNLQGKKGVFSSRLQRHPLTIDAFQSTPAVDMDINISFTLGEMIGSGYYGQVYAVSLFEHRFACKILHHPIAGPLEIANWFVPLLNRTEVIPVYAVGSIEGGETFLLCYLMYLGGPTYMDVMLDSSDEEKPIHMLQCGCDVLAQVDSLLPILQSDQHAGNWVRGPGRRFFIVDGGQAKYRLAESQMRTELENVTLGLFEPFFKNNHAYLKELLATQDVGKLRAATGLNESECLSFIDIFSGEITPASAAMVLYTYLSERDPTKVVPPPILSHNEFWRLVVAHHRASSTSSSAAELLQSHVREEQDGETKVENQVDGGDSDHDEENVEAGDKSVESNQRRQRVNGSSGELHQHSGDQPLQPVRIPPAAPIPAQEPPAHTAETRRLLLLLRSTESRGSIFSNLDGSVEFSLQMKTTVAVTDWLKSKNEDPEYSNVPADVGVWKRYHCKIFVPVLQRLAELVLQTPLTHRRDGQRGYAIELDRGPDAEEKEIVVQSEAKKINSTQQRELGGKAYLIRVVVRNRNVARVLHEFFTQDGV